MRCELCGKETDLARPVFIEGSKLRVCPQCARFGDEFTPGKKEEGTKVVIEERLQARERRMRSRDVYSKETALELAEDYPLRIKQGRRDKGWDQDALGAKLNEKKSVIAKLEAGGITPDEKLIKKLERALDIHLMEKVPLVASEKHSSSSKTLTLGDMIKIKKE
jgi:putative transcription factor